jgi:glycosyltransferase involved in cell wall biosynthesis
MDLSPPRPLLTIVTITRNDPDGLRATLESAAPYRRSHQVEHLVIDGSDDEHAGESPTEPARVRSVRVPPRGVTAALNEGLRLASGRWIWFLNGGDMAHPATPPDLVLGVLARTHSGAVVFNAAIDGGHAFARPPLAELWPPLANWIPHQAAFVRAAIARASGGFSNSYRILADWDFWLRLLGDRTTVDILDVPVAIFADGGLSSQEVPCAREALRLFWAHKRALATHGPTRLARALYTSAALVGIGYLGLRAASHRPRR